MRKESQVGDEVEEGYSPIKYFRIWKLLVSVLILFVTILLVEVLPWSKQICGDVEFAEILYHFLAPLDGTDESLWDGYITLVMLDIPIFIACVFIFFLPDILAWSHRRFGEQQVDVKQTKRVCGFSHVLGKIWAGVQRCRGFFIRWMVLLSFIVFLVVLCRDIRCFGADKWFIARLRSTEIYEDYYVDPATTHIEAPETKKNLIFIISESMEGTFFLEEDGGAMKDDIVPNLTRLAKENTHFSKANDLTGAVQVNNTGWTSAGMVAQLAGVPLALPLQRINAAVRLYANFLPGATTMGELLLNYGYNNELIYGTEKEFAATDKLFLQHGDYKIYDFACILEDGYVDKRNDFWGVDDEVIFQVSKDQILELAEQGQPFNIMIKTVDTHNPAGYICKSCKSKYRNLYGGEMGQYMDAIECQDRQIESFVDWCREQDFYENTVIVITGDHLSIAPTVTNDMTDSDYERTTYNVIINSELEPTNTTNRQFTTMDIYPTVLASLGFEIEGERLGLGTNLYSERPTIMEEVGKEYFLSEMTKNSKFFNKYIAGTK